MSRSLSGSVKTPPFPWLYPYLEDGPRLDETIHRPMVTAELVGPAGEVSGGVYALVDSGCHHVLVDSSLAATTGIDHQASTRVLDLGLGGTTVKVRFADARMRLILPGGTDDQFCEWETEVGFIDLWRPTFPILLGQRGFLDQFTVTMSNFARQTAVEALEEFDRRYGVPAVEPWRPGYVSPQS